MQKLLEDLTEVIENWPVWTVVGSNEAAREVQIRRSDEDQATLTIKVAASYPRGSISIASNYGGRYEGANLDVSSALDEAMEQWCREEEDAGGMGQQTGSAMFDIAAGGGGVADHIDPKEHAAATLAVRNAVEDPALGGLAAWYFSDAKKEFVIRVAVPLDSLEQFRANSLGLKRSLVLVVELGWHWRYLAGSDIAKVSAVFMCAAKDLGVPEPASLDANIGALRWYFTQRLSDAFRKNHVRTERKTLGFEEHDKRNAVEGLSKCAMDAEEDFFCEGNKNILVGVQRLVKFRLDKCTRRCLICDENLELDGMKTGICARELCRHSLENYGIGTDVLSEIKNNAIVSELLIYLSCASVSHGNSRDTFTPMCPVEVEGKTPPGYKGPVHFYQGRYGDNKSGGKNWSLLLATIQKIPSISTMEKMAKGSTATLKQELTQATDPLVYPLLQWILASNRTHLEPIPRAHLIEGMGTHQFYLISSSPEKERLFRQKKAAVQAKSGGSGSFFAWHGSACGNWHCILRNGLKNYSGTSFMSAGQAYGPGIYLAKRLDISLGYMGSPSGAWKGAELIPHRSGCTLIALCEVVADTTGFKDHGNDIVTVQDEDLVDTRFLFVFPDHQGITNNSVRAENLKIPKELLQHCS